MDKKYYEKLIEFMDQIPFNRFLGMKVDILTPGFARMSLAYKEQLVGDVSRPALHGGVISSLIDTCGGAALITKIEPLDRLSTVDLRIDYLRPGQCDTIIVEANILRIGNRVGVADMVAYQSEGRKAPIAIGRGTYNVIRGKG